MITKSLTVTNPKGIHARPSALIVRAAQEFDSTIFFNLNGMEANARQIMDVLSLGAFCGDVIEVTVKGTDEEAALARIEEIFSLNFNDS